ncbi:MAG: hypothetical protein C5B49_13070 [Bdellovibrio sp.]|nr:MAG: hypothetical protein C5B49_13070 [Bdellovibrio sp.]
MESEMLSAAVLRLQKKYALLDVPVADLATLGIFFLRSAQPAAYCELCQAKLDLGVSPSWPHFLEALAQLSKSVATPQVASAPPQTVELSPALIDALKEGAGADGVPELARSHGADILRPEHRTLREQRRLSIQERYRNERQELISQLDMLKVQGLEEDEERVILHLLHLFPADREIKNLLERLKDRRAEQILEQKIEEAAHLEQERLVEPLLNPEEFKQLEVIRGGMHRIWLKAHKADELGRDFAVALLMWDYPEASLDFLPDDTPSAQAPSTVQAHPTVETLWTRMEALLQARQFLHLLEAIDRAALQFTDHPEATFALLYYRAQALAGLGQRFPAIEIMESLVNHQPNYRSALTLLRLWKGGAT